MSIVAFSTPKKYTSRGNLFSTGKRVEKKKPWSCTTCTLQTPRSCPTNVPHVDLLCLSREFAQLLGAQATCGTWSLWELVQPFQWDKIRGAKYLLSWDRTTATLLSYPNLPTYIGNYNFQISGSGHQNWMMKPFPQFSPSKSWASLHKLWLFTILRRISTSPPGSIWPQSFGAFRCWDTPTYPT